MYVCVCVCDLFKLSLTSIFAAFWEHTWDIALILSQIEQGFMWLAFCGVKAFDL